MEIKKCCLILPALWIFFAYMIPIGIIATLTTETDFDFSTGCMKTNTSKCQYEVCSAHNLARCLGVGFMNAFITLMALPATTGIIMSFRIVDYTNCKTYTNSEPIWSISILSLIILHIINLIGKGIIYLFGGDIRNMSDLIIERITICAFIGFGSLYIVALIMFALPCIIDLIRR